MTLRKRLQVEGLDGALFLYAVDVYYFSGSRQNSALWIPSDGSPLLLVRKSYIRAKEDSQIDDVRPYPSSKDLPALFGDKVKKIGLTFDVLPVQHFQFYSNLLKGKELVDVSPINREMRSVKSVWEMEQMRLSGKGLAAAFAEIPKILKPGMSELDFAAGFEHLMRRTGIGGLFRIRGFNQEIAGLAAAGANAALPGCFDGPVSGRGFTNSAPYGPSTDVIAEGMPVIVDYGGFYNGYLTDMTRFFVFGKLDPELARAFDVALKIQQWIVENLKPGNICEDIFNGASRMAADAGLGDYFMGHPGELARFVGHGVGLELDELPVLALRFKASLMAGQTVAVEPKFLFPGRGAIGIENTFAITEQGAEKLTVLPDDIVYL